MSRSFRAGAALAASLTIALPVAAQKVDHAELEATLGEPVTTSVTGKPQRASEASAALTIITREQIARSPARDVPGLLKSLAGIDVNRWTAGHADVAVRGGVQAYNPSLLVMVDGRQVYLDHYGMTNWNLLGVPLEAIQQIELVRGPASAIFGFNAASGVVNIITRSGGTGVDAGGFAGDHGQARLGGAANVQLNEAIGLRLSAERAREDERAFPANRIYQDDFATVVKRDSVTGGIAIRVGPATDVAVDAGHAFSLANEFIGGPVVGRVRTETTTVSGRITHDLGWGSVDAQLYSNWLDYINNSAISVSGISVTTPRWIDNNVVVGKLSLLGRVDERTTVRVGGEFRRNSASGPILYSRRLRYDVLSADGMIDLNPTDRLTLTAAARLDKFTLGQDGAPYAPVVVAPALYDRSLSRLSFNAAVLVATGGEGQLRLNGGRGYQLPSLVALGIHVPAASPAIPLPLVVSGDPHLLPAAVWSAEIGYARPLAEGIKADANVFYKRVEDPAPLPHTVSTVTVGPTGTPTITSQFSNLGDVTSWGTELSLTARRGRWTGQANYTWTRVRDSGLSAQDGQVYFYNPADANAAHKANLDLGYDAGAWFATAVARYTSATRQLAKLADNSVVPLAIPEALALDATAGVRLGAGLTLNVAGENLTRARGAAGSPIWADRRVRAGIRITL